MIVGGQENKGVLKTKLGIFYFFMLADIILCTFVEPHINPSNTQKNDSNRTEATVIAIIQIAVIFILSVLFLILMWQTVPLRYGMVFDLLGQFKYTILLNFLMGALVVVERGYRLAILNMGEKNISVMANDYPIYYIFFYLKYIVYPFYYALLLESSLKLALPVYYNVKKWESN